MSRRTSVAPRTPMRPRRNSMAPKPSSNLLRYTGSWDIGITDRDVKKDDGTIVGQERVYLMWEEDTASCPTSKSSDDSTVVANGIQRRQVHHLSSGILCLTDCQELCSASNHATTRCPSNPMTTPSSISLLSSVPKTSPVTSPSSGPSNGPSPLAAWTSPPP